MVIKVSGLNSNLCSNISIDSVANNNLKENSEFKGNINSANTMSTPPMLSSESYLQNIKTPQKYTKIATDKLQNGTEVHSYKLANGYKVTIVPIEGSPSVVKTYVNVGSMNETPNIKGISHFLEHMAFNGTNGENGHIKLETGDSFKKIEQMGGWANATTNYAITDYVNSTPLLNNTDLETQIKVLSAMTEDLKLSDEMIKKEKGPVSSEINMILDNPQTIAMDQTVRTLFNLSSPADELVGGSVEHIQNLTRKDVVDYYNKYYTPDNTNIVITGDVNPDEAIALVSKHFTSTKHSVGKKYEEKLFPITKTVRKDYISDKAKSAVIMLGFAGPKNFDSKEKLIYSIAVDYLYSNTSGLTKNLKDINSSVYINSDKISTNPKSPRINIVEMDSSEENSEKALHVLYKTLNNLKPITQKELDRIKNAIIESREDSLEYSDNVNDIVGHAVLDGDLSYITRYNDILSEISVDDVNRAINQYFDLNKAAITVIHPKSVSSTNNVSFKAKSNKLPINTEKIEEVKLDNNFDIGFYNTKSNNVITSVGLNTDIPYTGKPGVRDILCEMYRMGTIDKTEDELNQYLESYNIDLNRYAGSSGISTNIKCNSKNIDKALEISKEILYRPRINEENLEKAKAKIKDQLLRQDDCAELLYYDYYAKNSRYSYTDKEILDALDSITLDDIKDFHKYVMNNSRGIVTSNLPESNHNEIRDKVIDFTKSLSSVKENNVEIVDLYKPLDKAVVLTKAKNANQADIKEIYSFKCDNSIKETVTSALMRSILSSSSIGLFDVLREKENLAYSVYADLSKDNNVGELSLNILTTTDNKDTGEQSFENLQKSINGFHNQIQELVAGKFTDEDIENAKLSYKAMLLNKEGIGSKVGSIDFGLNSKHGIDYDNQIFNEIDNVTREDIINMAKNVFSNKPVYSIVATQDTLDANKDYLNNLTV